MKEKLLSCSLRKIRALTRKACLFAPHTAHRCIMERTYNCRRTRSRGWASEGWAGGAGGCGGAEWRSWRTVLHFEVDFSTRRGTMPPGKRFSLGVSALVIFVSPLLDILVVVTERCCRCVRFFPQWFTCTTFFVRFVRWEPRSWFSVVVVSSIYMWFHGER